jgi:hypothetical protein
MNKGGGGVIIFQHRPIALSLSFFFLSQQLVVISRGRLRLVAWWRGAVLKKKNKLLFDSFSPFTVVPPFTHWETERGPGQQREMKTNKKEENLISGWKLYARQSLPTAQNRTEQNIYREVDPYNNSQRDDRCLSIGLISDPGPQRRGSAVLKMIVENRKVICINTRVG